MIFQDLMSNKADTGLLFGSEPFICTRSQLRPVNLNGALYLPVSSTQEKRSKKVVRPFWRISVAVRLNDHSCCQSGGIIWWDFPQSLSLVRLLLEFSHSKNAKRRVRKMTFPWITLGHRIIPDSNIEEIKVDIICGDYSHMSDSNVVHLATENFRKMVKNGTFKNFLAD